MGISQMNLKTVKLASGLEWKVNENFSLGEPIQFSATLRTVRNTIKLINVVSFFRDEATNFLKLFIYPRRFHSIPFDLSGDKIFFKDFK